MLKKYSIFLALFFLLAVALACANPLGGTAPAQPANVETVVALTFQALTPAAQEPVATLPPETSSLLPHPIYFLNADGGGLTQIFRLEKDGKTVVQVTFEPIQVDSYDVSLVDGSVAYVTNNQIFTVNADGSNRSMVVNGGEINPNNLVLDHVSNPLWSRDGQTITYGYNGINNYSIAGGQSTLMLENDLQTDATGFTLGIAYTPIHYSPDGSKLLVNIIPLSSDGSATGIFTPSNKSLVQLGGRRICCALEWTGDNSALYGGYASYNPFIVPGLWRVDASSGNITELIPGLTQNDTILNFASNPYLAADGQLYFFYATQPYTQQDSVNRAPLQLVRSAVDGVTNRTVISPDVFNTLNETLWAADGSFVVTVSGPLEEVYQGGIVEIYYTDGQRAPISLIPYAFDLKWGP